jgi:hypothetical protein
MNFPPNTKIAAYWCHPHFPKAVKTTPQPLIYSPHKYKTARDRHFENQIEYWTSLYLLASIHPPTPAKKNKNKNQQRKKIHKFVIPSTTTQTQSRSWKKANNTHPRNLLSQSDFQQLADIVNPTKYTTSSKCPFTLMQETCLWNSRWVEAGRKSAVKSDAPNSTPSTDILKSSFTRKRRRRRRRRWRRWRGRRGRRRRRNPNPNPNSFAWH